MSNPSEQAPMSDKTDILDTVEDDYYRLHQELENVLAILAKFRTTADGVYFNGKDTLYCPKGHAAIRPTWDGAYCNEGCCWKVERNVAGEEVGASSTWYDASELFSSEAAALSAQPKPPAEEK